MSKARLVITAVVVEKRTVAEVAATYGVSRSWLYELLARYRDEGEAAFEPRSRAPRTSPAATPGAGHVILLTQDLNVRIVNAITGELLRELTIDTSRDYQPRTPK